MNKIIILEDTGTLGYVSALCAKLQEQLDLGPGDLEIVPYLTQAARPRNPAKVAAQALGAANRAEGKVALIVDVRTPGDRHFGFKVLFHIADDVTQARPTSDFFLGKNFLLVFVTHYPEDVTADSVAHTWNQIAPGSVGPAELTIVPISNEPHVGEVLGNYNRAESDPQKRKMIAVYSKDKHDRLLWGLLQRWLQA